MKKTTNKLWIASCLVMPVGFSFVNGEMIQTESGITIDTDTKLMSKRKNKNKRYF
jgi:hypothetical protein